MARSSTEQIIADSKQLFLDKVWPKASPILGGGRVLSIEGLDGWKDFDTMAGVDAWQMRDDLNGIWPIASRVQSGPRAWNTFTIRKLRGNGSENTELQKRINAVCHNSPEGALVPYWTIQAYVDSTGDQVLSIGIAKTRDLFMAVQRMIGMIDEAGKYPRGMRENVNGHDCSVFLAAEWVALSHYGCDVEVLDYTRSISKTDNGETPWCGDGSPSLFDDLPF